MLLQGTQSINDECWIGFSKSCTSHKNSSYKLCVSDICQCALLVSFMYLYVLNHHYSDTYEMEAGLLHFKVWAILNEQDKSKINKTRLPSTGCLLPFCFINPLVHCLSGFSSCWSLPRQIFSLPTSLLLNSTLNPLRPSASQAFFFLPASLRPWRGRSPLENVSWISVTATWQVW